MNIEEREQGLLKLVEDYGENECHRLLQDARAQAAELIGRTYQRERTRLHERVLTERAAARVRIQTARAERDTRERAGGERVNARLLALAWPLLGEALMRRWQDPAARARWARGALAQAKRVLPVGDWTLRYAANWPEDEQQAIVAELRSGFGVVPGLQPDAGIRAGLVVQSAGAVLDASLDGILDDRPRLEARLLALLGEGSGA